MSISEQTLKALQELMLQDKELLLRVQASSDAGESAALIAQAAAQRGITISQAELLAHFEEAGQAGLNQALSDDELDAVAGGWSKNDSLILVSFLSFGIGCMVASIVQDASGNKGNCKDSFTDTPHM